MNVNLALRVLHRRLDRASPQRHLLQWSADDHWDEDCGFSCPCCRSSAGLIGNTCPACEIFLHVIYLATDIGEFLSFPHEDQEVTAALSGQFSTNQHQRLPDSAIRLVVRLLPKTPLFHPALVSMPFFDLPSAS